MEISSVGFSDPKNNSLCTERILISGLDQKIFTVKYEIIQISCLKWNNFRSIPDIKNLSVQNCSLGLKTPLTKFQCSTP